MSDSSGSPRSKATLFGPLGGIRFRQVRSQGQIGRAGQVRVWRMANQTANTRIGLSVVGSKSAVRRNRVRRRLRHIAYGLLPELSGTDIVVSAPDVAADAIYAELMRDVQFALARAQAKAGENA